MKDVTCKDVARCLSAFVDGELEPSDLLAIRAHLERCESCASRVAFARASRSSVRRAQRSIKAPESFQAHARMVVTAVSDAEERRVSAQGLLSWKVAGPVLAAAGFAFVWGAVGHSPRDSSRSMAPRASRVSEKASDVVQASTVSGSIDALVNMLVDQHANPLPPEANNVQALPQVERFVGVPVRWLSRPVMVSRKLKGKFLGMRLVDIRARRRAAMFQYRLAKNRRLSVYVYNPSRLKVSKSHLLVRRLVNKAPVYCGYVRGYSVAVMNRHGVGYAVASDLDEQETSRIVASVGR